MKKQLQTDSITIFESALFKTTSTVILTEDCLVVVDPNWLPDEVMEIKAHVDNIRGKRPIYLVLTHSDWDHIIGYGAFPDAIVIASQGLHEHPGKQGIINEISVFDDSYYLDREYPIIFPEVDIEIKQDGQQLTVGKTVFTFYLANGHTNDGIFMMMEEEGILIVGDYLSDVEFPYIYFSSEAYLHTLEKIVPILKEHQVNILIPGHGKFTQDTAEIMHRKTASIQYIEGLKKAIHSHSNSYHLIEKYPYPKIMKDFHDANITLIKQELGL